MVISGTFLSSCCARDGGLEKYVWRRLTWFIKYSIRSNFNTVEARGLFRSNLDHVAPSQG